MRLEGTSPVLSSDSICELQQILEQTNGPLPRDTVAEIGEGLVALYELLAFPAVEDFEDG